LPGEAWRAGGLFRQTAGLIGVSGLTVVTVAIGAVPALWMGKDPRTVRLGATAAAAIVLAVMAGYGAVRLSAPLPLP
ncbi:hypothetical protein ACXYUI_33110, partial [Klebsiella pneumoniae]